jgi:hypothetical protein
MSVQAVAVQAVTQAARAVRHLLAATVELMLLTQQAQQPTAAQVVAVLPIVDQQQQVRMALYM